MKKVILAYSGGLDTSCCVQWLRDKGFKVICFSADLGSEFSPQDLRKRAKQSGAEKIYIADLKKEFASSYILPAFFAHALYEKKYVLSTALGRPLIAKYLVDIAHKERAGYVAHGCSGKGNDQVRIDISVNILDPKLKIIAPLREWELNSREEEIQYARKNKIPIKASAEKIYSIDKNIWGLSVEAGILEDVSQPPPLDSYVWVKPPHKAKNKGVTVTLEFSKGVPVKLNSRRLNLVDLIKRLNKIGADCGIGRTDLIEDRTVGIKSREIYEAPAAWILYTAKQELENLVFDRRLLRLREMLSSYYADLVYQGFWFSRPKQALDSFFADLAKDLNGKVSLKLYRGNIIIDGRQAKKSLYKKELATYSEGDLFNPRWAEGFIKLWGLPYSVK